MALTATLFIPVATKLAQETAGANLIDPTQAGNVKLMLLTAIPDHTDATIDYVADVSANEVATGTGYVAGGPTITNYAVTDNLDGTINVDCDDVIVAEDNGTGFTNCTAGVFYTDNTTPADSRILLIMNAGGTFGNTAGAATITVNASGLYDR